MNLLRLTLGRLPLAAWITTLSLAVAGNAPATNANDAAPATGKLLTCRQMEDNCLRFAHRAVMAAGDAADVMPYSASMNACYDGYRQAASSGTWPASPPFSFALKCVK